MKPKIKIGIAGYGIVGKKRGECISKNQNLELVAVCDRYFESTGKSENGIYFYSDYKELLGHGIDALFVCLTNDVAAEVTIAGLSAGLHVFCEKPPGQNLEQIRDVIETEKKNPDLKGTEGSNIRLLLFLMGREESLSLIRAS